MLIIKKSKTSKIDYDDFGGKVRDGTLGGSLPLEDDEEEEEEEREEKDFGIMDPLSLALLRMGNGGLFPTSILCLLLMSVCLRCRIQALRDMSNTLSPHTLRNAPAPAPSTAPTSPFLKPVNPATTHNPLNEPEST